MKRGNRLFLLTAAFLFVLCVSAATALPAHAAEKEGYEFPSAGVAQILDPGAISTDTPVKEEKALNINEKFENEKERMEKELAMANVQNALNIRAEADEKSEKVGYLYKDCGGTILERKDGWTKLKSGNVIGWAKDEYLLFGEEAKAMAEDVGNWIVTLDAEAVRVRMEPNMQADIYGLLAYDDSVEFIDVVNSNWISVDYNDEIGYINTDYVNVKFHIDEGETMEVIRVREREEAERKRKANRGAVAADADELRLLGALIYCEAGNQPYEGQVAVGAVVINRVLSSVFPDTVVGVIYQNKQFSPVASGRLALALAEDHATAACYRAADEAMAGATTVGNCLFFRTPIDGLTGTQIGGHIFY